MTTLSMKYGSRVGTWNVRTLLQPSKMENLCKEFVKYNLLFLGLCETRWSDVGEFNAPEGLKFLYSGKPSGGKREGGVGFLLSKSAYGALIDWKAHSDRIISIRLRTRVRNITIIQCYAPTELADYGIKEEFYSCLSKVTSSVRKGDIMVIMGDFNAQLGSNNEGLENVMGRHGLGSRMTENGELFTEMCSNNNMCIGGTLFPHKRVHKVSWVSPDNRTENQIDHIAISRIWRGSLLDVRNKRGADIGSDHHLIVATIRLKIAAIKKNTVIQNRRFEVEKLKDPTIQNNFTVALSNAAQNLFQVNCSDWSTISKTFHDAAEQTVGHKVPKRKKWISDNTWNLINERREIKNGVNRAKTRLSKEEWQQKYSSADRLVKKSARNDKREWMNKLALQAQAAADTNRTRDLYKTTRELSGRKMCATRPLRNTNGELTTSKNEQLLIWTEYYSDLLSNPGPVIDISCDCTNHTIRNDISCDCPGLPEIVSAIKSLRSNKAAGPDNIPPDLLMADPNTSSRLIFPLIKKFWDCENLPSELKEGIIVKLPKKGNLTECRNWRGITLLNSITKILAHIISKRLADSLEPLLRREQAGFRPRRSGIDHVNSLRIIVEQSVEFRTPLYLGFIDFERAFDTLQHEAIWKALVCKGVPQKMINMIKGLYNDASCRILHEDQVGERVMILTGVRQGCVLSPLLFNIVLDVTMKNVMKESGGIQWGMQGSLGDLDYADDICLLAHKHTDLSLKLQAVKDHAAKSGLKINIAKTKILCINANPPQNFTISGAEIEIVSSFCYLGSIINNNGGTREDINSRIKKGRAAYGALQKVWSSPLISRKTKVKIFNSNVKSVLLYGCETWNAASAELKALQVFINRCLRKILRVFWPAVISNNTLWQLTRQQPIQKEICLRKWRWIGHTLRKPHDDIARQALDWNPQGSRRRGRPSNTWRRLVETEAASAGRSWNEIKYIALDRIVWNNFVMALCSS